MDGSLQAGSAQLPITPPLGVSMAGYYHDRRADGVIDHLYAKALFLSSGSTTAGDSTCAALVVCDLLGLSRELTDRAREMIAERTGIPPSQVMICCTHTHTGPVTTPWPRSGLYPDQAYLDVLTRKVADAVQLAYQRRQPASLYAGRGHVEGIAFNRRYWMVDGTLRTNPPFQSPDIDHPAGPIDPELGILLLRDANDQPLALVANYALHADEVGGTAYCADYQGVVARVLAQVLGERCVVLCPNGPCGDINHFDMSKPGARQRGYIAAERSGRALAGEVIGQLSDLRPVPNPSLRAGGRTFDAPLRVPSPEEVAWAEATASGEMHGFDQHGLDVVRAHRVLKVAERGASQLPLQVSALALGDVALVGLPGEVFVELGLAIKGRSRFFQTLVGELCNDSVGYIPTQAAYGEGGYESTSSSLQPGTGERMVEEALKLLEELTASQ